ncbi:hypothetical protein [Rheinheimera salexigens]|uniref:DUF3828 domain-containing protein n=1 Tax=Rheinheimera salexigens TaxID=1628148 RepID=A0A1E7Q796_9GAMM|nr:hypothetical protein [Rheinheimera salexigens]OEY69918.1 hypothetical protein BI198_10330 [Rheinheimera salexigens]
MVFSWQSSGLWFGLLLFLTACSDPAPAITTQWGTPEAIATEFFDALYNANDLDKAKNFSTNNYANLLESYGTTRQVSRILMNVSFDEVIITLNPSSSNVRQQYDDEAHISVVLTGTHQGKKIADMRSVVLVKQSGRWLVNAVKADKFSRAVR